MTINQEYCQDFLKSEVIPDFRTVKKSKSKDYMILSHTLTFESALQRLKNIISNNKEKIVLNGKILSIKGSEIDLMEDANFYLEYLCNIPFTFEYDLANDEYLCDFTYLEEEFELIRN